MDLGFQQADRVPEMLWPPNKGTSAQNADAHVNSLLSILRMEMYCPDVLFGGGGSSQRSTSSFAFMAIPLIAHIREKRANFSTGLGRLNKYILRLAAHHNIGKIAAKLAQLARVKCNWYPMLPRDTMEETTSIIARVTAGILSRETAIAMIGDILDIDGEVDKIKAWQDEKIEQQREKFAGATSGQLGGIQAAKAMTATKESAAGKPQRDQADNEKKE
jgi:hypothetical protein